MLGVGQKTGLKRTTAEKELLRSISAIEYELSVETDKERKEELESQVAGLRAHLSRLSGTTYTDLKMENARLKREIDGLVQAQEFSQGAPDTRAFDLLVRYYKAILERYSGLINEREQKTVGGIKALIAKDDLTIQSVANSISPEGYTFQSHFMQAAEKAFNYARDELAYVGADSSISFWLNPREMVSEKIGDDEDKAVFLCSLLAALGDAEAEVVIAELDNAKTHAFVITLFGGKFLLLDPCQDIRFKRYFGDKTKVLQEYSFRGSRIKRFLYRFNASKYEQFTD